MNLIYQQIEKEAASKVSARLRLELGLTPVNAVAELRGDSLTVTLSNSLIPMAAALRSEAHGRHLFSETLSEAYRLKAQGFEEMIARICLREVASSNVSIDFDSATITLTFLLGAPARPSGLHATQGWHVGR